MPQLTDIKNYLATEIWKTEAEECISRTPHWIRMLRWLYALIREIIEGGLNYRAMGLVYTTLLSLAPLLAVSFSVLKAFGTQNQLKPFLMNILEPLGVQGVELGDKIVGFVENIQVGVLGSVGMVLLIYSVISMLRIIEDSFNQIWRAGSSRNWLRRASDYLSIVLIGPVLVFSAVGVMASMANTGLVRKIIAMEPFGTAYYLAGLIIPYVLIISAFTFVYVFMPNTRVKFGSALIGGTFAGVAWKAVGWVFARFVAESASYNAIYSGFAIIILFMIWLYISWVTLLLGGVISFYYQHPGYLRYRSRQPELSHRQQEYLGFLLMYLIGRSYYEGRAPWTLSSLADAVAIPWEAVLQILHILEKNGLLVAIHSEPDSFLPARALETISLNEIHRSLRSYREAENRLLHSPQHTVRVLNLTEQIEQSADAVLEGLTLQDLVLGNH